MIDKALSERTGDTPPDIDFIARRTQLTERKMPFAQLPAVAFTERDRELVLRFERRCAVKVLGVFLADHVADLFGDARRVGDGV